MSPEDQKDVEVVIEFESEGSVCPSMRVSGVSGDLLRDPQRVRKLMDVLDLPPGTNARVKYIGSDVIVR